MAQEEPPRPEDGEGAPSKRKVGTPGYPEDTRGYPLCDSGPRSAYEPRDEEDEGKGWTELDLERFLSPREAAKLMTSDQPVAHAGKAGWAIERATGRAIWMSGALQTEVLMREPGAVRDEPGLTDFPNRGGLPEPAPDEGALRAAATESRRKRVQIGLKLTPDQAIELEEAADLVGVTRTTLARLLVVRGARELIARAKDSDL